MVIRIIFILVYESFIENTKNTKNNIEINNLHNNLKEYKYIRSTRNAKRNRKAKRNRNARENRKARKNGL